MPSRHRHHLYTPHSRRNRDTQPPPASPAIRLQVGLNGYFLQREISNLFHYDSSQTKRDNPAKSSQVKSTLKSCSRLIIPVSVSVLHARGIDDCSRFASSAFRPNISSHLSRHLCMHRPPQARTYSVSKCQYDLSEPTSIRWRVIIRQPWTVEALNFPRTSKSQIASRDEPKPLSGLSRGT